MAFPTWLIVSAVFILVLVVLFKTMNQVYLLSLIKSHFFWFFAIGFFVFLGVSLVYINAKHNLDYSTYEGLSGAAKVYFAWALNVFHNIAKVTGYVAQQDWVSTGNSTR